MVNDDRPLYIRMHLQARQHYEDIYPPQTTLVKDENPTLALATTRPKASGAQSPAEPSGEIHESGDNVLHSPHPMITPAVVISGHSWSDIPPQSTSYPAYGGESLIVDDGPSIDARPVSATTTSITSNTQVAAQGNNEPTSAPESHGRSSSPPTVAIVVPIVVIALLLPLLIFWYLSCRRRRQAEQDRSFHHVPPQTAILEKRMQANLARAREEWRPESLYGTKNTTDHASSVSLPLKRVQRPKSAQQFRTSNTPHNHFGGFNFDFSRCATTFSKRNTQRPLPDPSNRPSSIGSWEPSSPYPSRAAAAFIPQDSPPGTPIPHSPPLEAKQSDDHLVPGSEAALGLLTTENNEAGRDGSNNISPALSLHENVSPYDTSNQPLSDAISEISGLSVDHDLWPGAPWSARHLKTRSEVSALEPYPQPRSDPS